MTAFDVNAARAQRLAAAGGGDWEFTVDDETFQLPTELPRGIAREVAKVEEDDIDGLLALLLGAPQYERFARHEITVQDIAAVLTAYGQQTGLSVGEG